MQMIEQKLLRCCFCQLKIRYFVGLLHQIVFCSRNIAGRSVVVTFQLELRRSCCGYTLGPPLHLPQVVWYGENVALIFQVIQCRFNWYHSYQSNRKHLYLISKWLVWVIYVYLSLRFRQSASITCQNDDDLWWLQRLPLVRFTSPQLRVSSLPILYFLRCTKVYLLLAYF